MGGKWSKSETQEGSESESREWSFHLSRVPAAGASLTSSNIIPEWQLSRARPLQMIPRGTEMDVLGRAHKILVEEASPDGLSLKDTGERIGKETQGGVECSEPGGTHKGTLDPEKGTPRSQGQKWAEARLPGSQPAFHFPKE